MPKADILRDSLRSPALTPSEEITNKELNRDIEHALGSLNNKERIIIKLLFLYEKQYSEISQILNIPLRLRLR